jgi:hypothetical protein
MPIAFAMYSNTFIQNGLYLIKCNRTSNGRSKRFVKFFNVDKYGDCGYIRWATKDKYLNIKNKF